jgi:hypothetical protein
MSPDFLYHSQLLVDRSTLAKSASFTTSSSTTVAWGTSLTSPASPMSAPPTPHRSSTSRRAHRRREPTPVSLPLSKTSNRDPELRGELPGTSFPGHSPPVGRFNEPRAGGERGSSPVSAEQVEWPKWARPFSLAGPSATAGVANCNSATFLLSFHFFKIQFKFSLNF